MQADANEYFASIMKRILLVICLITVQLSSAQSCHCSGNEKGFVFKEKVVICGTASEPESGNTLILSEFTVKNCFTGKYLIDTRLDAMETFAIKKFADSVTITDLQLIPDSTMSRLMLVPLSCKVLSIASDGSPHCSKSKFIFKIPDLTGYQKRYVDSLCKAIKACIKHDIHTYPSDESSVYMLFLGALSNYSSSYDLFVNLGKYFNLDGAIAETRAEIPFEYIIKNTKKYTNK